MLENVKMSANNMNMISRAIGVEPVFINSALVSAQNRQRYYWCNWSFPQPADRGVLLVDILEQSVSDEWDHTVDAVEYMNRVGSTGRIKWSYALHSDTDKGKSACVVSNFHKGVPGNVLIDRIDSRTRYRKFTPVECERLQGLPDNYTAGISNTQRYIAIGNGWQCDTIEHIFFWLLIHIAFRR